jgi:hypothetical protein
MVLQAGCAEMLAPVHQRWPIPSEEGHFLVSGDILQVTGVARLDMSLLTDTQRRSDGRDRALLDACRRLRDYLDELPKNDRTIGEYAALDPVLRKKLDALVYSARPSLTRFTEDSAAASVEIERSRINEDLGTDLR